MKPTRFVAKIIVSALAVMACGWFRPCFVAAQTSPVRFGVLTPGLTYDPVLTGLREELGKLGYRAGTNVKFIIEDSQGDLPSLVSRAVKLVETKPDVLLTVATATTAAAKRATEAIPIVFTAVGDPVQAGLVSAFASSQNNLTGVSSFAGSLAGKRLEILKEIAPGTRTVLAIVSVTEKSPQVTFGFLKQAAKKIGVHVVRRDVTTVNDVERVLDEKFAGKIDAIFYVPSVLVAGQMESLILKANRQKVPLAVNEEFMVKMGALTSYGGDYRLFGAQAAKLVVKILKGSTPSQIPIETPDRLILSVNLITAKAIGLKIPRTVLERADRLVE